MLASDPITFYINTKDCKAFGFDQETFPFEDLIIPGIGYYQSDTFYYKPLCRELSEIGYSVEFPVPVLDHNCYVNPFSRWKVTSCFILEHHTLTVKVRETGLEIIFDDKPKDSRIEFGEKGSLCFFYKDGFEVKEIDQPVTKYEPLDFDIGIEIVRVSKICYPYNTNRRFILTSDHKIYVVSNQDQVTSCVRVNFPFEVEDMYLSNTGISISTSVLILFKTTDRLIVSNVDLVNICEGSDIEPAAILDMKEIIKHDIITGCIVTLKQDLDFPMIVLEKAKSNLLSLYSIDLRRSFIITQPSSRPSLFNYIGECDNMFEFRIKGPGEVYFVRNGQLYSNRDDHNSISNPASLNLKSFKRKTKSARN